MNTMKCLRCGEDMQFLSNESIKLANVGPVIDNLLNLISGGLKVNIFVCPKCRKLEFFLAENETLDDETPKNAGALGLLYQWGRKDPFLGSSSISSDVEAKSTITWPSAVSSDSSNGTIAYVVEHPTTYITYNSNNFDWYYTGSSSTDDTRWQSDKTIYDPCPAGWRVPDGGSNGVWSIAKGSSPFYSRYDSTNKGINFSADFDESSTIWYPASGYRYYGDGELDGVDFIGNYWSVTPYSNYAYSLRFNDDGYVRPADDLDRARGQSVRCLQESE